MVLVWYWCSAAKVHNFLWTDPLHWHILVLEKGAAKKKGLARLPNRIARSRSPSGLSVRPSVRPSYNVGTYVCLTKMMDLSLWTSRFRCRFLGVSVSFPASLSKFSLAAVFCWLPAFSGARRVHTGVSEKKRRGEKRRVVATLFRGIIIVPFYIMLFIVIESLYVRQRKPAIDGSSSSSSSSGVDKGHRAAESVRRFVGAERRCSAPLTFFVSFHHHPQQKNNTVTHT